MATGSEEGVTYREYLIHIEGDDGLVHWKWGSDRYTIRWSVLLPYPCATNAFTRGFVVTPRPITCLICLGTSQAKNSTTSGPNS